MVSSAWVTVALGGLVTLLALLGFLTALAHGLRTGRWWPVVVIAVAWLLAMAAYSVWEGTRRESAAAPTVASHRSLMHTSEQQFASSCSKLVPARLDAT